MREFDFIELISKKIPLVSKNIIKGIGDDASVFFMQDDKCCLITTDILVEDVHFKQEYFTPYKLGLKAVAVNVSDMAAMGGMPDHFYVSMAIPKSMQDEYILELYDGIMHAASDFSCSILGGDTTSSPGPLFINITLIGYAKQEDIVFRHTAGSGDIILVTGNLGDSAAGLYLLNRKKTYTENEDYYSYLIDKHISPIPCIDEGQWLAGKKVSSMIDVSDGLSSDLTHICKQSGVGAVIRTEHIPLSSHLGKMAGHYKLNPMELALNGGEDYQLLFTVAEDRCELLCMEFEKEFKRSLYPIGRIIKDTGIFLQSGSDITPLKKGGWDHFSTSLTVKS